MPITTIGNIITGNIPVLTSYLTQDPVEKTAFFESGILSPTPYAAEIARGPSNIANIPYWKSIDASIEPNYSNDVYADVAEPRNIETGDMMARVAYLNEGFGQADLTVELTSKNPLQSVAARLDNFWQRQAQRRLLATSLGTDPASANAQGRVTVSVNKRIRKTLTAGTAVEYLNPYSEMRMTTDTWAMSIKPVIANGSYQFREAF